MQKIGLAGLALLLSGCQQAASEPEEVEVARYIWVTNHTRSAIIGLSLMGPAEAKLLEPYGSIGPRVTKFMDISRMTEACKVSLRAEFESGAYALATDREICQGSGEIVFDRKSLRSLAEKNKGSSES